MRFRNWFIPLVLLALANLGFIAASGEASSYTITPGGPAVTATTTANNEDATVTFDGTAGQRVSLNLTNVTIGTSTCCAAKVSILKPDGTALVVATYFGKNGLFIDTKTLPVSGTYKILIDPQGSSTGSVTLTLYDVPADAGGSITAGGASASISTTVPGQNAALSFAGTANQRVSVKVAAAFATKVTILKPDGVALAPAVSLAAGGGFVDTKTLATAGTYKVHIDPQGAATGTTTVTLYDVPADVSGTIVPGGAAETVTMNVPGQNGRLTFAGTAGQRVSLKLSNVTIGTSSSSLTGGSKVSIVNPDGTNLVAPTGVGTGGAFIDVVTLQTTGTYAIFVDPQSSNTGSMTLNLYDVPADITGTLPNGTPVTVTTTVPGQNARLTFTSPAPAGIKLTVGPSCCGLVVSILYPDGRTLATKTTTGTAATTLQTTLPAAGTYSVLVDYRFELVGSVTLSLSLDDTPPTAPVVTLTETTAGPDAHVSGLTYFYRPAGVGTKLTVDATSSDAGSGLAKITFPGMASGFSPTVALDDTAAPYNRVYSWTTGATYSNPTNNVVAVDTVGNRSTTSFAVVADSAAPVTTDDTAAIGSAWKNTNQTVTLTATDNGGSGVATTRYTTNGTDPTSTSTAGTSVALTTDGVHTVKYFSTDNVSNVEAVKTAGTQIRIDKTIPGTATLNTLPTVIRDGQALTGTGTDATSGVASISYLYCAGTTCTPATLIGTSSTAPSYSVTWTLMPADGAYRVLARATDNAGNVRDSAIRNVTIDNTAPAAPVITKQPGNPSNTSAPSFTFTGETGARFECALDGPTFTACTSPKAYTGLTEGSHAFQVKQFDVAGNPGPAASYTWTVDLTAPTTTITSAPASSTVAKNASFSFTSSEAGSTFQCSLDGAAFAACTSPQSYAGPLSEASHTFQVRSTDPAGNTGPAASHTWTVLDTTPPTTTITAKPSNPSNVTSPSFSFTSNEPGTFECQLDSSGYSPCTSPKTYTGVAEGSHTFNVRAIDVAGNVSTGASATWTVDTTAPTTTIGTKPANPTNATGASFSFTASEAGSTFECQLDAGAFAACTSPKAYTALAAGSHTFGVRARDAAGNTGPVATYTWTIDLTAPTTTITVKPSSPTNATGASFEFTASEASTFECQLDAGAFAACTSPKAYTALAPGSHTFGVRAKDTAGNTGVVATHTWTIDTTAPTASITAGPSNPSNSTSASLSFTSTEAGSTFECRLDGSAFAPCTSPKSYTALADGSHTFEVRTTDPAGNVSAVVGRTWTVDTVAPTATITVKPATATSTTSASFEFTSSEAGSTFECQLDGGAFAACTSPKAYTSLADGSHTFGVRATDPAGNAGPVATHTWTVDTVGPATTISSKPVDPTNATTASFAFSSEAGATFQCQLDGGVFAACTSPEAYSGLGEGSHTFAVRATDTLGNAGPSATHTWRVDTTAPAISISSTPANPSNSAAASFGFSSEAAATFQCRLDGAAAFAACTSPKGYTGLAEGSHTFEVKASDPAGNTSAPASFTWTIDTTAPTATITAQPASVWASPAASFSFTTSEAGSTFECQLDTGAYAACTSPKNYTGLADGSHTFRVRATDAAGNTGAAASYTWTTDTTGPTTTITAKPANPTNSTSPTFSFTANETGSRFQCQIDGSLYANCTSPHTYAGPLADGQHTVGVRAVDAVGNVGTPTTYTWTVDTAAPTATISSGPSNPSTSSSATFSFTASQTGSTFECQLDGGTWAACTSPKSYTGVADGSHTFSVRATDPAGNTGAADTSTWTIDTTGPTTTISAAPAASTTSTAATFEFAANESGGSFECRIDAGAWEVCTSPKEYTTLPTGDHVFEVRATDALGNTGAPATHAWTITA
jgi:hypothetical protein